MKINLLGFLFLSVSKRVAVANICVRIVQSLRKKKIWYFSDGAYRILILQNTNFARRHWKTAVDLSRAVVDILQVENKNSSRKKMLARRWPMVGGNSKKTVNNYHK